MKNISLAIIDDEAGWVDAVRKSLTVALGKLNHTMAIEEFESTVTFLARWDEGYRPDAIKCDMRLEGDMEGPERLYMHLKAIGEQHRMFFATANLSRHDEEVQARTGAEVFTKDRVADPVFYRKLISMAK